MGGAESQSPSPLPPPPGVPSPKPRATELDGRSLIGLQPSWHGAQGETKKLVGGALASSLASEGFCNLGRVAPHVPLTSPVPPLA